LRLEESPIAANYGRDRAIRTSRKTRVRRFAKIRIHRVSIDKDLRMNRLVLLFLPLCLFAADNHAAVANRPAPARRSAPIVIPADAQQLGPYTYRATDKAGKTWIYQRSPFGILKMEEVPEMLNRPAPEVPVTVVDKGDSVRFELPTPFGRQVWEHKKSELTPQDRAFIAKYGQGQKPAAASSAAER
jgi:hypothetical protein